MSFDIAQLPALVKVLEDLNVREFASGDLKVVLGPKLVQRDARTGTITNNLPSRADAHTELLDGRRVFDGLTDDMLLGLEEIPKDHPVAKRMRGNK
jgi:hypothetical protein